MGSSVLWDLQAGWCAGAAVSAVRGENPGLIRCLVVARDPLARAGLASLLQGEELLLAGAADENEVEQAEGLYRPDVLIWDLGAGAGPGGQLRLTRLPVILLGELSAGGTSQATQADGPAEDAQIGAEMAPIRRGWGLLPRTATAGMLRAAVRAVLDGLAVFDPAAAWQRFNFSPGLGLGNTHMERPDVSPGERLTGRELEVLDLLAQGLPNKQIALRLGISDHTVKFHLNALMGKLGAETRTEAVTRAVRAGWLQL